MHYRVFMYFPGQRQPYELTGVGDSGLEACVIWLDVVAGLLGMTPRTVRSERLP